MRFVEVLALVSRRTSHPANNTDVLRLYQRWQRTGSEAAAWRLAQLGVVPRKGDGPAAVSPRVRRRRARASVLSRLQLGLEALYRVRTNLEVDAFGHRRRAATPRGRRARRRASSSSCAEEDGELGLALFVDGAALANLGAQRSEPTPRRRELRRLLRRARGREPLRVSRAVRGRATARCRRSSSSCKPRSSSSSAALLLQGGRRDLRQRLYHDVTFAPDLDADEHDRYRVANAEAARYTAGLERRFVREARVVDMLDELAASTGWASTTNEASSQRATPRRRLRQRRPELPEAGRRDSGSDRSGPCPSSGTTRRGTRRTAVYCTHGDGVPAS